FADRYSVVRDAGRPRRRKDLVAQAGQPILWQARLMQFSEHVSQLGASPQDAAKEFAILPPAGLLPVEWFTLDFAAPTGFALTQPFFPLNLELSARPAPLEQMDALIDQSAYFEPIRIGSWDRVEILVPVPQVYYEASLLLAEAVDPTFLQSLRDSIASRA